VRTIRILKCLQISGNTSLSGYDHVSIDLFPQSISVGTSIKSTEGPHPLQEFGLAESDFLFCSEITFLGCI